MDDLGLRGRNVGPSPSMNCRKPKKDLFLYLIFLISPFAYWIDRLGHGYSIIVLFTLMGFFSLLRMLIKGDLRCSKRTVNIISISAVIIIIYTMNWIINNPNEFYYTRFFLTPFLLIVIFGLYGHISSALLLKFIQYLIIVSFAVLSIEAFLINFGLAQIDLSPAYQTNTYQPPIGYYIKPFGLTGNCSVNGTTSAILGLLYYAFTQINKQRPRILIYISALLSVIIAGSGQGYLTLIVGILLSCIMSKVFLARFIAVVLICITWLVVLSGVVWKISLKYMIHLYNLFAHEQIPFTISRLDVSNIWFGSPSSMWPIDLFPLFVWGNYGIIYFCLYWFIVFCGFLAYKNHLMTICAIMIFLGSLHYPTAFYFHVQLLIAVIIVSRSSQVIHKRSV